ncbi:hypothetical protein HPB47_007460 [Ixodes persulcatus]|uniref:Uncharacterized protein n=1 Tax=Ixodes persulcatus TaxID=34615 RepID=A0AC60P7S9_IXOPE|nr:hypothetical protein HPB47_007460 [Ixodes persulcatus]
MWSIGSTPSIQPKAARRRSFRRASYQEGAGHAPDRPISSSGQSVCVTRRPPRRSPLHCIPGDRIAVSSAGKGVVAASRRPAGVRQRGAADGTVHRPKQSMRRERPARTTDGIYENLIIIIIILMYVDGHKYSTPESYASEAGKLPFPTEGPAGLPFDPNTEGLLFEKQNISRRIQNTDTNLSKCSQVVL